MNNLNRTLTSEDVYNGLKNESFEVRSSYLYANNWRPTEKIIKFGCESRYDDVRIAFASRVDIPLSEHQQRRFLRDENNHVMSALIKRSNFKVNDKDLAYLLHRVSSGKLLHQYCALLTNKSLKISSKDLEDGLKTGNRLLMVNILESRTDLNISQKMLEKIIFEEVDSVAKLAMKRPDLKVTDEIVTFAIKNAHRLTWVAIAMIERGVQFTPRQWVSLIKTDGWIAASCLRRSDFTLIREAKDIIWPTNHPESNLALMENPLFVPTEFEIEEAKGKVKYELRTQSAAGKNIVEQLIARHDASLLKTFFDEPLKPKITKKRAL